MLHSHCSTLHLVTFVREPPPDIPADTTARVMSGSDNNNNNNNNNSNNNTSGENARGPRPVRGSLSKASGA
eukprot:9500967-Pyramimonas_sp.AAC.1